MSGIMAMLLGAVSSAAGAIDEFFNRVTLLLPGNGTNGAQNNTFLDSSSNNFSITRNGNTTQGTFTPFSQTGWSNFFDGTDDYLAVADNVVLRPGTSNFTLEAWIWRNASSAAHTIYAKGGASTGIVFQVTSTNVLRFTHTTTNIDSTGTIAANAWTHIAVVREGTGTNQTKLYINGTQDGQGTVSTDFTQTEEVRIGTNRGATDDFNGYISNLRFVKGTALYTGAFTPSTSPLTTTSQGATATEVELLTCQSNRFVDNSSNGFALTLTGTPSVQAFSPFAPTAAYSAATVGGSGYFDGTGDGLSVTGATANYLGSGDFTVETWVYLNNVNTLQTVLSYQSTGASLRFFVNNATIWLLSGGTNITSPTGTAVVTTGQWIHLAVVRSGSATNNVKVYVNGVGGTLQGTSTTDFNVGTLYVGLENTSNPFSGYMSGFRIIKGQALTSGDFTPSTAPVTASAVGWTGSNVAGSITGSVVLVPTFTNAGITDATAKNDLETVGNAQISTTQSKFGGSSMYFDGNGDYLSLPARPLLNVSGGRQFTIEFWVYTSSTARQNVCIDTASAQYWDLCIDNLKVNFRYNNAGVSITSVASITSGAWNHVAVCWTGSAMRIFINGTMDSANSATSMTSHADAIMLLGYSNYSPDPQWMNGYIDDFRITNGLARYTGNFTAPTTAFALQ